MEIIEVTNVFWFLLDLFLLGSENNKHVLIYIVRKLSLILVIKHHKQLFNSFIYLMAVKRISIYVFMDIFLSYSLIIFKIYF